MTKCKGFDEDGSVCGRPSMYKSDYCKNHRGQDPSIRICMGKSGSGPCKREVIAGELFCRQHIRQIADIEKLQCPQGCGQLSYRMVDRNGYYACRECKGTMLDAKSMETRLSKHANTLIGLLGNGEVCSLKCPRCEVLMLEIKVACKLPESGGGHIGSGGSVGGLVLSIALSAAIAAATESISEEKMMVIDGCRDCGTFWFDASEMKIIKQSDSVKGLTAAEIDRREAEVAEKKAARERMRMRSKNANCLHVDDKAGRKCRRVAYRSTEYCHAHQPK